MDNIAAMLRDRRLELGLQQGEVAMAARIGPAALSRFEAGTKHPNLSTLTRWSGALGCHLQPLHSPSPWDIPADGTNGWHYRHLDTGPVPAALNFITRHAGPTEVHFLVVNWHHQPFTLVGVRDADDPTRTVTLPPGVFATVSPDSPINRTLRSLQEHRLPAVDCVDRIAEAKDYITTHPAVLSIRAVVEPTATGYRQKTAVATLAALEPPGEQPKGVVPYPGFSVHYPETSTKDVLAELCGPAPSSPPDRLLPSLNEPVFVRNETGRFSSGTVAGLRVDRKSPVGWAAEVIIGDRTETIDGAQIITGSSIHVPPRDLSLIVGRDNNDDLVTADLNSERANLFIVGDDQAHASQIAEGLAVTARMTGQINLTRIATDVGLEEIVAEVEDRHDCMAAHPNHPTDLAGCWATDDPDLWFPRIGVRYDLRRPGSVNSADGNEVNEHLTQIAAQGPAVGVHLILAGTPSLLPRSLGEHGQMLVLWSRTWMRDNLDPTQLHDRTAFFVNGNLPPELVTVRPKAQPDPTR